MAAFRFDTETLMTVLLIWFLIVMSVAFLRLLAWGDNKERTFQKIIGGFAVFIVAIFSRSEWVLSLSLFIGGLIIASEHFMKMLVAILRADSKDIKDLIKIESATPEELAKKEKEKQEEVKEVLNPPAAVPHTVSKPMTYVVAPSISTSREIEEKVAEKLSKEYGLSYMREAKVSVGNVSMIFDGVLSKDDAYQYELETPIAVEIKYIPNLQDQDFSAASSVVSRTLGRIWSNIRDIEIIMVLVGDNVDRESALVLSGQLKEQHPNVKFAIFSHDPATGEVEDRYVPHLLN